MGKVDGRDAVNAKALTSCFLRIHESIQCAGVSYKTSIEPGKVAIGWSPAERPVFVEVFCRVEAYHTLMIKRVFRETQTVRLNLQVDDTGLE